MILPLVVTCIVCIYIFYEIYVIMCYTKYSNIKLDNYKRIYCLSCQRETTYRGYKYYYNPKRNIVMFECVSSIGTICLGCHD